MKKIKNSLLILILALMPSIFSIAQVGPPPPPPPPGGDPTSNGGVPVGGAAPIRGGVSLLVFLALGYGLKKVILERKAENDTPA